MSGIPRGPADPVIPPLAYVTIFVKYVYFALSAWDEVTANDAVYNEDDAYG